MIELTCCHQEQRSDLEILHALPMFQGSQNKNAVLVSKVGSFTYCNFLEFLPSEELTFLVGTSKDFSLVDILVGSSEMKNLLKAQFFPFVFEF